MSLTSEKAREMVREGAIVIDCRSEGEFRCGSVAPAINIPYHMVGSKIASVAPSKDTNIILFCLSGARSGAAQGSLASMGYTNVYNVGTRSAMAKIMRLK